MRSVYYELVQFVSSSTIIYKHKVLCHIDDYSKIFLYFNYNFCIYEKMVVQPKNPIQFLVWSTITMISIFMVELPIEYRL
jgi:hypothetical protein